ncbi:hypothetical protein ABH973_006707 [Bradyrhizobium ottawaense]|uniref:hypothetical protein n=1 Tax=Bradyrhizobium ottawaense TaxID=931866 RepID=UPI003511D665
MQQSALEALADELGEVAGAIERDARLRIDALLADLGRRDAERELRVVQLERRLEERLSSLKDGAPGRPATAEELAPIVAAEVTRQVAAMPPAEPGRSVSIDDVRPLLQEMVSALPPAEPGKSVSAEDVAPVIAAEVARQVAALPPAEAGKSVTVEDVAPLIETEVARHVALLPPAEPGKSVTVEELTPLLQQMVDALPPAEAGKSITVDDVAPLVGEEVARQVALLPAAEPGKSVTVEEVAPLIETEVARQVALLPPAEAGRSVTVDDVAPLIAEEVERAVAALPPAEPGPRGEPGPEGKLPVVKAWEDRVHYEGEVVTHEGATWQASKDTGRSPPDADWLCIARAGADGVSPSVEGTFDPQRKDYRRLSIVALNGGSFVARRDDPGPCPGEGWQLLASVGKRGQAGERGPAGVGARGPAGPAVISLDVADDGVITLVNADGSTVRLDLYPLLSKLSG